MLRRVFRSLRSFYKQVTKKQQLKSAQPESEDQEPELNSPLAAIVTEADMADA